MIKLIKRIGFFRLLLTPMGLAIMMSAWQNQIIGMGIIGLVVLLFGLLNRCLMSGACETDFD